ncbi:chemotaxis protein CheB [Marinobacter sp. HL-58]|uniref:chemotaxis protein CheB n=1 Tax=Marinobacter sp. HL-58 TaxID=1479237 RepID=UPI00068ED52E|nr:chemotaxis protein CheB [Marinobacter sp. HL-58]KPP97640.1 MAG: two-component system, chemotaxis family, CheB/CheR fusion protein [Marinobacter sp. HL-58]
MRIVGIGASAGGLAALEDFFRHTPADTGMAFIVVQHLDPTQKALLPELLQRFTDMPVQEARQDQHIQPNTVYVIPSNAELTVTDNLLKLQQPREPRGMRLPINVLFSSLASARSERAIAVVLSGMGSDGTLGLQAIRATGGLAVVQEPGSAEFDAMPLSAIAAGCADIVAPASELPGRILSYNTHVTEPDESKPPARSLEPIDAIIGILQQNTRHDFSLYKPSTLLRRIERRMAIHGIATMPDYIRYLEENSQEVQLLFKELLIGVTSFFRDPDAWDYLCKEALPALIERNRSGTGLRAWVVGCSTGEEAYSLAMVITEVLEQVKPKQDIGFQIFASDLSLEAIAVARAGRYPESIEAQVSKQRLARFFTRSDNGYQINQPIRDKVLFAQHDVILDPPFTKLDLLACRNLLIYFDPMLQRRLLPLFHYSLRENGLLMLGNSETVGRLNHLFEPLKQRLRLYRRLPHDSISGSSFLLKSFPPLSTLSKEQPVPVPTVPHKGSENLQTAADHLLLQVYAPAAVVLNRDADIVYISGRTGKYLEPAAGKANWNIHAMAREGLRTPLYTALKQAAAQREPVELHNVAVETGAGVQHVDVTVQALSDPAALKGMTMVVFREAPAVARSKRSKRSPAAVNDQSEEILRYQQAIEQLSEEARLSREELQASNEELQSTNEELQSANEELTSSKEEMQSMNEELQTINAELQAKLDDLALAQSDMQNVLNSIEIAILFMDQNLNVRRYTARASNIISLRESDVGRPLSELTTILDYPELEEDARETLNTLVVCEKQIATNDGRWFSIRIIPYRRLDNVIDGVVMTMVDITDTKELESSLRKESASPPSSR